MSDKITNISIQMVESSRDEFENISKDLGINRNKFITACAVYALRTMNADTYKQVVAIMDEQETVERSSNAANYFGTPKPPVATPTATKTDKDGEAKPKS